VIRVVLPAHLKNLAKVTGEVRVEVTGTVTQRGVLDALEAQYPMLGGTIRDRSTGKRRAFIRFYACEDDLSNESPDAPLPEEVAAGKEPLLTAGRPASRPPSRRGRRSIGHGWRRTVSSRLATGRSWVGWRCRRSPPAGYMPAWSSTPYMSTHPLREPESAWRYFEL
jgi:sulfur-carrier protein